jgi:hypothetical protein
MGSTSTNVLRMPFVARDGIDPALAQALKNALLEQHSPAVVPKLTGFRQVLDHEYDPLREQMKEAARFGELEH